MEILPDARCRGITVRVDKGRAVRGSIVGTRKDLEDSLRLANEGSILPETETQPLEAINDVFDRLKRGDVQGHVVLGFE